MHVANRSLFINFASLAWAFNITSSVPAEETDTLAFTSAANSHPLPLEACVLSCIQSHDRRADAQSLQALRVAQRGKTRSV